MAKIKLTGESSGYVEISAGNAAGNNILETPTSGTRLVAHEGSQDVTLNGSLNINGDVVVGGGLTITNVLSYEDVSNIDAIGVVTARSGVHVGTESSGTLITGNSSGIGIGTDSPTVPLNVRKDDGLLARFQVNTQTSSGRISCIGGTASYAAINFGDKNSVSDGKIRYYNDANNDAYQSMLFYTNNNERIRIGSAGQIGLNGENYGTNNQVLTSRGTGSAAVWSGVNAAFYGYQGTSHNIATGTWTVVKNLGGTGSPPPIDTPGWDSTTGLFTADANTAGTWYIFGSGGIDDIQTLDVVYMGIMINGTNPSVYTHSRMYSGAANSIMGGVTVAAVVTLADGDTVGVGIYHNEGTTEPTEPNRCFAGGFRLSV
tara:strand:+ start:958 stop:2076 length:1119 start_codon:yes stop_codon:yes gene_type:complete